MDFPDSAKRALSTIIKCHSPLLVARETPSHNLSIDYSPFDSKGVSF